MLFRQTIACADAASRASGAETPIPVIAVPLGLIAIELAAALIIGAVMTAARMAGLKPWLVLISRDGRPVAAVAVRGWRTSRALIAALRARMT